MLCQPTYIINLIYHLSSHHRSPPGAKRKNTKHDQSIMMRNIHFIYLFINKYLQIFIIYFMFAYSLK